MGTEAPVGQSFSIMSMSSWVGTSCVDGVCDGKSLGKGVGIACVCVGVGVACACTCVCVCVCVCVWLPCISVRTFSCISWNRLGCNSLRLAKSFVE